MPVYRWRAIDLRGVEHAGQLYARSVHDLEQQLLAQERGLMAAYQLNAVSWLQPISLRVKADFFKHLAMLHESGVLIPQALALLVPNITHQGFKMIIQDVAADVQEGYSLSAALERYAATFSMLMQQLVHAGQESGQLRTTLSLLSDYLEMQDTFYRGLRSALMLPAMTLSVFVLIAAGVFVYLLPSFAPLFASTGAALPGVTRWLLQLSAPRYGYALGVFMLLLVVSAVWLYKKNRLFRERFLLRAPLLSTIVRFAFLASWLRSMGVLVSTGVPLRHALTISQHGINNSILAAEIASVGQLIEHGESLSVALRQSSIALFPLEFIAMVEVAQESGKLGQAFMLGGVLYQQRLERSFVHVVSFVQPVLLVLLGGFIALLIAAIYLPIVQMPMAMPGV